MSAPVIPKSFCNFIPAFPLPKLPSPKLPTFAIPVISLTPMKLVCMLDRFV